MLTRNSHSYPFCTELLSLHLRLPTNYHFPFVLILATTSQYFSFICILPKTSHSYPFNSCHLQLTTSLALILSATLHSYSLILMLFTTSHCYQCCIHITLQLPLPLTSYSLRKPSSESLSLSIYWGTSSSLGTGFTSTAGCDISVWERRRDLNILLQGRVWLMSWTRNR